jgi:hypothetical protein
MCSFRGIPRVTKETIPRLETEENVMKKISFTKYNAPANRIDSKFLSETCFGTEFREFVLFFFFTERNSKHFSSVRNGLKRNTESFLFRGMVQNGIPRVCFYFSSMVQNLRNGSEQNSESFLFRGTAGIPPEQTSCSVYSVFHGNFFCRKLPTLIRPSRTIW